VSLATQDDFTTDSQFRLAVADLLDALLDQVDNLDTDDLDVRMTAGNLTATFEDGSVFILSQMTPRRELWLSANFTAWHFNRKDENWTERDTGESMLQILSGLFSAKLGMDVTLG